MVRYTARRMGDGWELTGDRLPTLFVRSLSEAHSAIRSALPEGGQTPKDGVSTQLRVDMGGDLEIQVRAAVQATVDAREAQLAAAATLRRAVVTLHVDGLSGRDISYVLGVSPQRVSQLLAGNKVGNRQPRER